MSFVKKLIPIRIIFKLDRAQNDKRSRTNETPPKLPDQEINWIGNAIEVANLVANASDMAHFPAIKGVVGIFIQLLERLQVSRS